MGSRLHIAALIPLPPPDLIRLWFIAACGGFMPQVVGREREERKWRIRNNIIR